MFTEKNSIFKWCNFFGLIAVSAMFLACSDDKVAGGSSDDAGIYAVKDLDVAGVSQKGPFVKGSVVTVQGIDCKTMKLTGESFEGTVKSDKGDYDIDGISLSSSCAVFEVTGLYVDEFTGAQTTEPVTLRSLVNLKDRKSVNVNVLTQLEYGRVVKLVSEQNTPFADAKKQAEKEVLGAFEIDSVFTPFEDLNIVEDGEDNAALLAVSVLVLASGDSSKNVNVEERLEKIGTSIAETGIWADDEIKSEMAEWAFASWTNGQMKSLGDNLEKMGYPSNIYDISYFTDEFVDSVWVDKNRDPSVIYSGMYINWSIPKEAYFNPDIKYDSVVDSRDGQIYKTVKIGSQTWMAENLNYADSVQTPSLLGRSWCFANKPENCAMAGRLYTWTAAVDSVNLATDKDNPQDCGYEKLCNLSKIRGICPEGFHLPDTTEWRTLISFAGGDHIAGGKLESRLGMYRDPGTDDYGFSAFPAGNKYRDREFFEDSRDVYFWLLTEYSDDDHLAYWSVFFYETFNFSGGFKDMGVPVRCVMD